MEGLVNIVVSFIALLVVSIPLLVAYKYRYQIKGWVSKPSELSMWEVNGVKRAEREVVKAQWKLDDAEEYLQWKREKEARTKETETGE